MNVLKLCCAVVVFALVAEPLYAQQQPDRLRSERNGALLPAFKPATAAPVGQKGSLYDTALVEWVRHYGSGLASGVDVATDVAVDASGNVYVTGKSEGPGTSQDYATVKYNSSGVQEWMARYNGPANGFDIANAVAVDAWGNVYVTGLSLGFATWAGYEYATVKYNSSGVQQWVARYHGAGQGSDAGMAIVVDDTGNAYVTGSSWGDSNLKDYATIKYNTVGVEQWVARYNSPANHNDEATAIALDQTGNVYVTGSIIESTWLYYPRSRSILTIKYDAGGVQQWTANFQTNDTSWAVAYALAVDSGGNVVVTGGSSDSYSGLYAYATVKYNSDGIEQWRSVRDDDHNSNDFATSVALDASGNVYVTGVSGAWYAPWLLVGDRITTVKYDTAGATLWRASYEAPPGYSLVKAAGMAVDNSGNVFVAGSVGLSGYELPSFFRSDSIAIVKYASNGATQWVRNYDARDRTMEASGVTMDDPGNLYLVGATGRYPHTDFAAIKYSSSGFILWESSSSGPGSSSDFVSAMEIDASGNVYVTGSSKGAGTRWDYLTVKFDPAGNQLWSARYDGPAQRSDHPVAMAVDNSGNVFVTGSSEGVGTEEDWATVKYNSSGSEIWVARHDNGGYENPSAICVDNAGNALVTGLISYEITTVKYSPSGQELWTARYDTSMGPSAILADQLGNVYVTAANLGEGLTIKYNAQGLQQWTAAGGNDVAVDDSGNVYVTSDSASRTRKYSAGGSQSWISPHGGLTLRFDDSHNVYVVGPQKLLKLDPGGNMQWQRDFPESFPADISLDASSNVILVRTEFSVDNGYDFVTAKYDPSGQQQWSILYDGYGYSDIPSAVRVDNSGNIYVAGELQRSDFSPFPTIVKYNQVTVNVEETGGSLPETYWLAQNYPNPFNPSTTFSFNIPYSSFTILRVFDLLGREVATLVDEELDSGTYSVQWNSRAQSTGLASGVYLYRLEAGNFVQTRKMILLR